MAAKPVVVVVVFGGTGMLGSTLVAHLSDFHQYRVVTVRRGDFEFRASALAHLLRAHHADVAVNCTKYVDPEGDPDAMARVNTELPHCLAEACDAIGVPFVHISTNDVFRNTPLPEDAPPYYTEDVAILAPPDDAYGRTKLAGEPVHTLASILRVSIVGESDRGTGLLEWVRKNAGREVDGYDFEMWNGVTCLELAKHIEATVAGGAYWRGVRHFFGPETVSKYRLVHYINDVYGLNLTIRRVEPSARHPVKSLTLGTVHTANAAALARVPTLMTQLQQQKTFAAVHRKAHGTYRTLTTCRFCDVPTTDVLKLGDRFGLAGAFLSATDDAASELVYPLTLAVCPACKYMQCKEVVLTAAPAAAADFYHSSMIESLKYHFAGLARWIAVRHPDRATRILEMGCNDGVLLHPLRDAGYRNLVGVDPSRAALSVAKDIVVFQERFDDAFVERTGSAGAFDLFVSCNSFAHVDAMDAVVRNVKRVLKPAGEAVVEVHHSLHLFADRHFDFICHEHMGYYTATSLARVGQARGLTLTHVEAIPNHGGSIRCVFAASAGATPDASVAAFLEAEAPALELTAMLAFEAALRSWKTEFQALFYALKANSEVVYGYGASGRANTLLNFAEIQVDGMIDDAPSKVGTRTPVFHVPVEGSGVMYIKHRPTVVLLLAWPYADAILKKHARFLESGGKFVVPLPTIRVIS